MADLPLVSSSSSTMGGNSSVRKVSHLWLPRAGSSFSQSE